LCICSFNILLSCYHTACFLYPHTGSYQILVVTHLKGEKGYLNVAICMFEPFTLL
jgi:hypothetical protein